MLEEQFQNTDIKRPRGGQPGNQNARKHGYYCSSFSGVAKNNIIQALQVTGLDNEIALARANLKAVALQSPTSVRLFSEAASTLIRLLCISEKLGFARADRLDQPRREDDLNDILADL